MKKTLVHNRGQTLIELIMALGAGVLIVIAIIGGVVAAGKNSQFAKNQSLATRYAQEGVELIRSQRDKLGWSTLYADYSGKPQCIAGGGIFSDKGNSCGNNVATIFSRDATFIDDTGNGTKLSISVTVSWQDSSGTHQSTQTTLLTSWQ